MNRIVILLLIIAMECLSAGKLLIPMDATQSNHLRAYGIAYASLEKGLKSKWLLNYRGGSFLLPADRQMIEKAIRWGVAYEMADPGKEAEIYSVINDNNMEALHLEKAPKIAVYTPESAKPWDDAVTLALDYAKIPYKKIYDADILKGKMDDFDWLHLHHEDFTAQYSKFYSSFRNARWYQDAVFQASRLAEELGFSSVAEEKKAVARRIAQYVKDGGLLFAMCYATETLDIALASEKLDIVPPEIDGTSVTPGFNMKLDYSKCIAFKDFAVNTNPMKCYISDIDYNHANTHERIMAKPFHLFDFSAKFDPVPCLLTQCHERVIRGFFGLTTSYSSHLISDKVTVLARVDDNAVKYVYARFGKGSITFYGGHDPEDYSHAVYDKPTDLSQYPCSPGYRLILNNVLYPAAEKKKLKT